MNFLYDRSVGLNFNPHHFLGHPFGYHQGEDRASHTNKKREDRLELNIEDDVAGFLGIKMRKHDDGSIELLQTGLVDHILWVMGLEEAAAKTTPAETTCLVADKDGPSCQEKSV